MGLKKNTQRKAKADIDEKLFLSTPDRDLLESLAVECASNPSADNTFQYAFALSKSRDNQSELRYAVTILDSLVKEGYEHQTDCMFGAAQALYLLGEYDEARKRCEAILRSHPESRNTAELHLASIDAGEEAAEKRMEKVAATGAAAAVAVGLLVGVAGMVLNKR